MKILSILKENAKITGKQLAIATDISYATVRREMAALQAEGIIRRIGSDKAGHWEIIG